MNVQVGSANEWRLETPGEQEWEQSARPGAANKYLMISVDCHANEPPTLWRDRMDKKYHDRLPRVEVDKDGVPWSYCEGQRPYRLVIQPLEGEDQERSKAGANPEDRLRDHARDGIDAEIIFPNKGFKMWATPDAKFASAQCGVYNDWIWETFGPYNDRMSPAAALATADIEGSIAEVERSAKRGFRLLTLPCKPVYGGDDLAINYNSPEFDPLWAVIEETGLPIAFHIGSGRDPRGARAKGGAVTNYLVHTISPAAEPVCNLCAAGVIERFPKIRFGVVETGIGWIPWALDAMDEAYIKHHMFVSPKLKALPSEYFRMNGFATFGEDPSGIALVEEFNLVDNCMWANDYPHHEGTWPHSAEAIERMMGRVSEVSRAKMLGVNAARVFGFDAEALRLSGSAA